jgi:hypothetical protein
MPGETDDAVRRAQAAYDAVNERAAGYRDFADAQLEESRRYFDLSSPEIVTKPFDVLTTLVGLPIPSALQGSLAGKLDEILGVLPDSVRVYRVRPELLHWESHIIQRPGEPEPAMPSDEITERFVRAVSEVRRFEIGYAGFFVAPDGTIAFQGLGPTGDLRASLRRSLPFSSPRQNETGHISVARILDPVGDESFRRLLEMRRASAAECYGVLAVAEVKLVSERRWYMEDHDVICTAALG